MKILIGLTGNAGAGKTTVANMLRELGFEVIDADKEAHQVLNYPEVKEFLRKEFPEALEGEKVNRERLGRKVFFDRDFKERFERIIRPLVMQRIKERIEKTPAKVVVVDAALLFEYGVADAFDTIIVVWAPEEELVKRMVRRGIPEEKARAILASQMPQEEKVKRADFVIRNYGSIKDIREQVRKVFQQIMRKIEEVEFSWYL